MVGDSGGMPADRTFARHDDLTDLVRAAFGSRRTLREVTRLRGGTSKGVYRLALDDGATAVLYRWHSDEDYWPAVPEAAAGPQDAPGPFTERAGLHAFTAAHTCLTTLGVRVPAVHLVHERHHGADVVLVEDVRGGSLEALLERDPAAGARTLDRLGEMLHVMHGHTTTGLGPDGAEHPGRACEEFVLARALTHLQDAAGREPRIAAAQDRLEQALQERASAVRPRSVHGLIHGELGPDHVLVDDGGAPVLIDIEGLMFFDVEWEHAFLELRFGTAYPRLRPPALDGDRLQLYRLALYLSLVAGPLRLLDGDFPHRAGMRQIAEWNTERALATIDAR